MSIRHFIAAPLLLTAVTGAVSAAPDDLWPNYRRDGTLAGISSLKGGLGARPVLRWSVDLGAPAVPSEKWRVADFNGDGTHDFLRVLPDRLICESFAGQRLWEAGNLRRPAIVETRDFSGSGSLGILVRTDTGTQRRISMIDGANGQAVFLYATQNSFGGAIRVGKILPDVAGEQLCAWWSGDPERSGQSPSAHGYLWSFERGLTKPTLRFEAHPRGTLYAPLHLFADMDGDRRTDMVIVSHENIWCWDLASGKLKYHDRWGPEIRTYWAQTAAVPLTAGELPTLLMINPMIPGVQVVTQNGKKTRVKWKRVVGPVESQYQNHVVIGPGAPDPFVDLDRNGTIEILAAVKNEHGDHVEYLTIFDANTGARVLDAPHLKVIAVDDLDGDRVPEVLIQEKDSLRIANWNGARFVDRWEAAGVKPYLTPTPPEGDLQRAVGARITGPNRTLWREEPGVPRFLLKFPGSSGAWACELEKNGEVRKVHVVERHAALGNVPDPTDPKGTYSFAGSRVSLAIDGKTVRTHHVPARRRFLPPPPIAGTLGGETRVIARDAAGTLRSYAANGQSERALITNAQGPSDRAHLSMEALGVICDLDGDGENELVAGTTIGGLAVVAVDANGKVKRRFAASRDDSQWVLGGVGHLGKGRGSWVIIRHKTGDNSWVTPWVVDAYDGKTGATLWQRASFGSYGAKTNVKFALHIPTAVYDYNGDGADDLLAHSENFYGIIDVTTGKDLVAPADGRAAQSDRIPGHWTAYATPVVARLFAGKPPHVLMSRAFALTEIIDLKGNPLWHYGLTRDTTARSHAGLGDLNGDGRLEVVTSQDDGLLRAFAATPREATCPTCPPHQRLTADTKSGTMRWEHRLVGPVSDFASADLDGDGRHELLVGTGDGKLVALKEVDGKCTVLWQYAFAARVGSPVVADLDHDGTAEILVPVGDGYLHCLGARRDG